MTEEPVITERSAQSYVAIKVLVTPPTPPTRMLIDMTSSVL
jgi:hypothetical protein